VPASLSRAHVSPPRQLSSRRCECVKFFANLRGIITPKPDRPFREEGRKARGVEGGSNPSLRWELARVEIPLSETRVAAAFDAGISPKLELFSSLLPISLPHSYFPFPLLSLIIIFPSLFLPYLSPLFSSSNLFLSSPCPPSPSLSPFPFPLSSSPLLSPPPFLFPLSPSNLFLFPFRLLLYLSHVYTSLSISPTLLSLIIIFPSLFLPHLSPSLLRLTISFFPLPFSIFPPPSYFLFPPLRLPICFSSPSFLLFHSLTNLSLPFLTLSPPPFFPIKSFLLCFSFLFPFPSPLSLFSLSPHLSFLIFSPLPFLSYSVPFPIPSLYLPSFPLSFPLAFFLYPPPSFLPLFILISHPISPLPTLFPHPHSSHLLIFASLILFPPHLYSLFNLIPPPPHVTLTRVILILSSPHVCLSFFPLLISTLSSFFPPPYLCLTLILSLIFALSFFPLLMFASHSFLPHLHSLLLILPSPALFSFFPSLFLPHSHSFPSSFPVSPHPHSSHLLIFASLSFFPYLFPLILSPPHLHSLLLILPSPAFFTRLQL
ncbi:hypothetical protein C7M84_020719, partial [Penaeus vannamei]